jgi:hypothetical protein
VSEAGARSRNPERPLRRISLEQSRPSPTIASGPFLDFHLAGMQKLKLTMFAHACYSSLVPRVHPSLLCAVNFPVRLCVREICSEAN